jgi:hypothetical protein
VIVAALSESADIRTYPLRRPIVSDASPCRAE